MTGRHVIARRQARRRVSGHASARRRSARLATEFGQRSRRTVPAVPGRVVDRVHRRRAFVHGVPGWGAVGGRRVAHPEPETPLRRRAVACLLLADLRCLTLGCSADPDSAGGPAPSAKTPSASAAAPTERAQARPPTAGAAPADHRPTGPAVTIAFGGTCTLPGPPTPGWPPTHAPRSVRWALRCGPSTWPWSTWRPP